MHTRAIPTGAEIADPVDRAAANLGVSRAFLYREMKNGRLASFTAGSRRLISRRAQAEYVARREAESSPPRRAQ
jgi:excisionase family DNA binding protein